MAIKAQAVRAVPFQPTIKMTLRIEGLTQIEPGVFELDNVPEQRIDYSIVGSHLEEQGVEQRLVEEAVERMADFIWVESMATVLAKRMVRQ